MTRTLLALALVLASLPAAWAGPMPPLPDLPPLPEHYESVGTWDGAYAGLVGGVAMAGTVSGTIGVVAGAAMAGDSLIVGLEGMGLLQDGSSSLEGGLRLGMPLAGDMAVFSQLSLGTDSATGMFAGLGASLEWQADETLTWRAQYRHAFDLSGDPRKGALTLGAVFNF